MSSNTSGKGSVEERDVAEVKKAMAMGQAKELSASPGMYPSFINQPINNFSFQCRQLFVTALHPF
jgi:hypothetical protein